MDESAGNIEMGKLPAAGHYNQGDQEEARSPDEIVFQLDNNGNIYERKDPYQVNHQAAYVPQAANNNFGFDNNAFGNNPIYGGGNEQENANENMWKHSEEQKYPFEANNDDDS